jgi:DNA-binding MarR family transcriptional regulator
MFSTNASPDAPDDARTAPTEARVARTTARTIPWVMGTLSAAFREQGEGLHASQLKLLMTIHHQPVSPSELAERMEVSLPTVSKTLDVLVKRGLVERTIDETDRRRHKLSMTDDGRATLRRVLDAGIAHLSQVFSHATPAELERIESGMEALGDVYTRAHPDHASHHGSHVSQEGAPQR